MHCSIGRTCLVVGCPEAPPDVLVVQDLHLEGEVLFHVLHNEDEEGQFDAQGLRLISRAADIGCADIRGGYLQDAGRYVGVGDALYVSISHCDFKVTAYFGGKPTPRKACV